MKEIIKNILLKISCLHDWRTHSSTSIWGYPKLDKPEQILDTLICKKCGNIKQIYV